VAEENIQVSSSAAAGEESPHAAILIFTALVIVVVAVVVLRKREASCGSTSVASLLTLRVAVRRLDRELRIPVTLVGNVGSARGRVSGEDGAGEEHLEDSTVLHSSGDCAAARLLLPVGMIPTPLARPFSPGLPPLLPLLHLEGEEEEGSGDDDRDDRRLPSPEDGKRW
jgi:hypothetical protein